LASNFVIYRVSTFFVLQLGPPLSGISGPHPPWQEEARIALKIAHSIDEREQDR